MKLRLLLFFSCCLLAQNLLAQNRLLDSLAFVLSEKKLADTSFIKTRNEWAFAHRSINSKFLLEKSEENEQIIKKFFEEKRIRKRFYDFALADAVFYQAVAFRNLGNYYKSIKLVQKSIQLIQSYKKSERLGYNYQFISDLYRRLKAYDKASFYLNRALTIFEDLGSEKGKSYCYGVLAQLYKEQGKIDQAEKLYKSIESLGILGNTAYNATNELGILAMLQKDYQKALELFTKNKDTWKNYSQKDIRGESLSRMYIAHCYNKLGRYADCITELESFIVILDVMRLNEERLMSFQELSFAYEQLGNYKRAFFYSQRSIRLKDSIAEEKRDQEIVNVEVLFEIEKKETQIRKLEKDNIISKKNKKEQQLYVSFLAILLLILVLVLWFMWRNISLKRKNAQILFEKSVLIKQAHEELGQKYEEIVTQERKLQSKNEIIEKKNFDIISSINYAQRIQQSTLPDIEKIQNYLDCFVFYRPKDIVSGDFYWFSQKDDRIIFALIDCTGHGVPGAFMTMIANNLMNQIVNIFHIYQPNLILENLLTLIGSTIKSTNNKAINDGMDIAVCKMLWKNNKIEKLYFSGAMMPIYVVQEQEIVEIRADKVAISASNKIVNKKFELHEINTDKPTTVYLATDGYQDQFGGKNNKKFMKGNFRKLLLEIAQENCLKQEEYLEETLYNWIQEADEQQIDDITVIGIRID